MDAAEFKRQLDALSPEERRKLLAELDAEPVRAPSRTPNLADPAEAMAHRAMEAIVRAFKEEFLLDAQTPNVTVVASVPPDGRVGIATTEPDLETAMYALRMGWGATHRIVRLTR